MNCTLCISCQESTLTTCRCKRGKKGNKRWSGVQSKQNKIWVSIILTQFWVYVTGQIQLQHHRNTMEARITSHCCCSSRDSWLFSSKWVNYRLRQYTARTSAHPSAGLRGWYRRRMKLGQTAHYAHDHESKHHNRVGVTSCHRLKLSLAFWIVSGDGLDSIQN